jgi:CRISP-associated protein Cas1
MPKNRIIFKDFEQLVPMVKDRWTPIYLQYGRIEVDNYSIKFVSHLGDIVDIPCAMISAIILGPGTSITHAAITICSKSNTPIIWTGEDGLYFYSFGVAVNETCKTSIKHAELHANTESRLDVARRMFKHRFPDIDVSAYKLPQLMGLEGVRVRNTYESLAKKYDIPWAFRNTNGVFGIAVDDLNLSLNLLNYSLYCICLSVVLSMGYVPALGFIHVDGKIPFIYDVADLFKHELTIPTAFEAYSHIRKFNQDVLFQKFSERCAEYKLLQKLPKILKDLIK